MIGGEPSTAFAYELQWICAIDGKASWDCSCEYLTVCIKVCIEYLDRAGRRDGMSSQVHGGRQVKFPNMDHLTFMQPGRTNKYSTCKYSTIPFKYKQSPLNHPRACAPSTITATAAPNDGVEFRGDAKVLAGIGAFDAFIGFHDFGGRSPI